MSADTKIEWTDATWNPVRGCSRVSDGCRNCYAERVAARFSGHGMPYEGLAARGKWTGKTRLVESALDQPLRWKRPRRIFVNSMSDLFHESMSDADILRVFDVMRECANGYSSGLDRLVAGHTFQILTKRPARMRDFCLRLRFDSRGGNGLHLSDSGWRCVLPNVWLGVSVENQAAADERIPLLCATPAAVRFLSCEPLLGPVDLKYPAFNGADSFGALEGLHWVIAGGESGPGARPMHPDWARSLRDQCAAAGVPFFFKQWGEFTAASDFAGNQLRVGKRAAGRLLDGREHSEFPR